MTRITKLIALMAATAGVAGGIITTTNPTTASANTKVRYYKNMKPHAYKIVKQRAQIYTSGKINHKSLFMLGAYGDKGDHLTIYKASHVTINGHKRVYYMFKGHFRIPTGWVWSGALKRV